MRIKTIIGTAVAAALIASPVMAAGSASNLSVAKQARASAPVSGASALQDSEDNSGLLLAGAAAVAAAVALYFIIDSGDDDDDESTSP